MAVNDDNSTFNDIYNFFDYSLKKLLKMKISVQNIDMCYVVDCRFFNGFLESVIYIRTLSRQRAMSFKVNARFFLRKNTP